MSGKQSALVIPENPREVSITSVKNCTARCDTCGWYMSHGRTFNSDGRDYAIIYCSRDDSHTEVVAIKPKQTR